ncbi:Transcription initiation factor TFIID subunit 12 [Geranomyces variabilis]|nr:Transcription initiation factor TFIID subunit 12 [Geranomyces variabilis]
MASPNRIGATPTIGTANAPLSAGRTPGQNPQNVGTPVQQPASMPTPVQRPGQMQLPVTMMQQQQQQQHMQQQQQQQQQPRTPLMGTPQMPPASMAAMLQNGQLAQHQLPHSMPAASTPLMVNRTPRPSFAPQMAVRHPFPQQQQQQQPQQPLNGQVPLNANVFQQIAGRPLTPQQQQQLAHMRAQQGAQMLQQNPQFQLAMQNPQMQQALLNRQFQLAAMSAQSQQQRPMAPQQQQQQQQQQMQTPQQQHAAFQAQQQQLQHQQPQQTTPMMQSNQISTPMVAPAGVAQMRPRPPGPGAIGAAGPNGVVPPPQMRDPALATLPELTPTEKAQFQEVQKVISAAQAAQNQMQQNPQATGEQLQALRENCERANAELTRIRGIMGLPKIQVWVQAWRRQVAHRYRLAAAAQAAGVRPGMVGATGAAIPSGAAVPVPNAQLAALFQNPQAVAQMQQQLRDQQANGAVLSPQNQQMQMYLNAMQQQQMRPRPQLTPQQHQQFLQHQLQQQRATAQAALTAHAQQLQQSSLVHPPARPPQNGRPVPNQQPGQPQTQPQPQAGIRPALLQQAQQQQDGAAAAAATLAAQQGRPVQPRPQQPAGATTPRPTSATSASQLQQRQQQQLGQSPSTSVATPTTPHMAQAAAPSPARPPAVVVPPPDPPQTESVHAHSIGYTNQIFSDIPMHGIGLGPRFSLPPPGAGAVRGSGGKTPPPMSVPTVIEADADADEAGSSGRAGTRGRGGDDIGGTSMPAKRKLNDLVEQIDPSERLEPEAEDFLLRLANEFVADLTQRAVKAAKHRGSPGVGVKDFQLELERNWSLRIPGHAPTDVQIPRRAVLSTQHQQRLSSVHKQKVLDAAAARKRRAISVGGAAGVAGAAGAPGVVAAGSGASGVGTSSGR